MNPYRDILKNLADAQVEFIVGGGVACVLHGVERLTMDVDVAVHMQPANLGRFIEVISALGLKPRVPVSPQALLDPVFVRMMIEEKHALVFSFLDPDQPIRHVDMFLRRCLQNKPMLHERETMARPRRPRRRRASGPCRRGQRRPSLVSLSPAGLQRSAGLF